MNQATLFKAARAIADTDIAVSRTNGRSRQEDRTVEVFPAGETLRSTPCVRLEGSCEAFFSSLLEQIRIEWNHF